MHESSAPYLQHLLQLLDQSVNDYKAYLEAGKTFRYAQVLKANNGKALELLTSNMHQLPVSIQADAAGVLV